MSQHMLDCNFTNAVFSTLKFGTNLAVNYAASVFAHAALNHAHIPVQFSKYFVPAAIVATNLLIDKFNGLYISDNTLASGMLVAGVKLSQNHHMLVGLPVVSVGLAGVAYSVYMNAAECNNNVKDPVTKPDATVEVDPVGCASFEECSY